jgi:hypothetical protein
MTRFRLLACSIALGGLMAAMPPLQAQPPPSSSRPAGQPQEHQGHHPAAAPDAKADDAQPKGMPMMMADMAAMDARLEALVVQMNAATGDAKVNAIAETVTALVREHKAMRDGMMRMHGQMMGGMQGGTMKPKGGVN